jgi:hypothetical protein
MSEVAERDAELVLVCIDCAGRWAHDWIQHWSFTHCPRCAGELRIDRYALSAARRRESASAVERDS